MRHQASYYPVFLDLRERRCLVVGGGPVAARKALALARSGARVRVVAPEAVAPLRRLAAAGRVSLSLRPFRALDARRCAVVVAATDDPRVNDRVSHEARAAGALCNVVDDPGRSSFIAPSVWRRGQICVAVSTSGQSPLLARLVRQRIQKSIGPEYAKLAARLHSLRVRLKASRLSASARRAALLQHVSRAGLGKDGER